MSCNGRGYGKTNNTNANFYLNSQFLGENQNYLNYFNKNSACRRNNKSSYPSFTPIIYGLSIYSLTAGISSNVTIYGANFLPFGVTYVMFGDYNLVVNYFSSFQISFSIPLEAGPGNYSLKVVNIYNDNFSPQINLTSPAKLNYSQSLDFLLI